MAGVEDKNIILHGCATMPEDDITINVGGAIATSTKLTFALLENTGTISVLCEVPNVATITITGRNAAGEKKSETITMSGVEVASGTIAYAKLLKAVKYGSTTGAVAVYSSPTLNNSATCYAAGTLANDSLILTGADNQVANYFQFKVLRILAGGTTNIHALREIVKSTTDGTRTTVYFRDLPAVCYSTTQYAIHNGMVLDAAPNQIMECRRICYDAAAESASGSTATFYEKIFVYNQHSTKALTNAQLSEVQEGLEAGANDYMAFAMEATLNATTNSGTNRRNPGNWSSHTFNSSTKSFANSQNFSPQSGQGVILRLSLPPGTGAQNTFYKIQVSGQSDS